MHKGIIRLLKGVFMDMFSVNDILYRCAIVLGHLNGLDPEDSLYVKQCETVVDEIKSAKREVSYEYFVAKDLEEKPLDIDILVRVDNSLARALGYLYLYQQSGEEYLVPYVIRAMTDASLALMATVSDACICDDEDSELEDMVFNGNEELDEDGIIRLWKCDDEDIVEE